MLADNIKKAIHLNDRDKNTWLMVSTYSVVMSFAIALAGLASGFYSNLFLTFLLVLADSVILGFIAMLLGKIKMAWLAMAALFVITVAELFCAFFYHSLFSVHVVQLILETNTQESTEFLSSAMSSPAAWQTLLTTMAVVATTLFLTRMARRHSSNRWLVTISILLIAWSAIRQASAYRKVGHCLASQSIAECTLESNKPHLDTPYIRLAYGMSFNLAATKELNTLSEKVSQTTVEGCTAQSPLIVLIIGESFSKHHTPLFTPGYRNTNPHLMAWKERGNLVLYTDAVSPSNITSHVFRYMFSTWDDECPDDWTHHTLFPAVFRKAGYDVNLITNQFVMDSNDDWNHMGGTIFNHRQLSDMQFTSRNSKAYKYDGEMLAEIPKPERLKAKPTLLIVHLYGQHVTYEDRCPTERRKFTADNSQAKFGDYASSEITAHYDNATLYNDAVVNDILAPLASEDAIAIYLSDHGEEVYDWRNQYERTNEDNPGKEVLRYQYEIPMMFFMSDKYIANHPDIADRVRSSANRRFISTDLSNVLFHLAGITTCEYKPRHDILSDKYDKNRRRITFNNTDYDRVMGNVKM